MKLQLTERKEDARTQQFELLTSTCNNVEGSYAGHGHAIFYTHNSPTSKCHSKLYAEMYILLKFLAKNPVIDMAMLCESSPRPHEPPLNPLKKGPF